MGVLMNIYCVPQETGAVEWSVLLGDFEARNFIRPPYRAGTPFHDDSDRASVVWPENWIVPETLRRSKSLLPQRDFPTLEAALAYIANASDATITMDAPQTSFRRYPDERDVSGALALYRFGTGTHFVVGAPRDFSDVADEFPELAAQNDQPKWEGRLTELLWLHGKCVPPEEEFRDSSLQLTLARHWPVYRVFSDEFL